MNVVSKEAKKMTSRLKKMIATKTLFVLSGSNYRYADSILGNAYRSELLRRGVKDEWILDGNKLYVQLAS